MSLRKASGYQRLNTLEPPPQGWSRGVEVRVKEGPFAVRLFKLVAPNGDIEWVVPNNFAFILTWHLVEATTRTRWQVEAFHRSFKQLAGAEKCQCRRAQAWVSLRQFARQTAQQLPHPVAQGINAGVDVALLTVAEVPQTVYRIREQVEK